MKHIYTHKRAGYGYRPGDPVTQDFAKRYPYLVGPAPDDPDKPHAEKHKGVAHADKERED